MIDENVLLVASLLGGFLLTFSSFLTTLSGGGGLARLSNTGGDLVLDRLDATSREFDTDAGLSLLERDRGTAPSLLLRNTLARSFTNTEVATLEITTLDVRVRTNLLVRGGVQTLEVISTNAGRNESLELATESLLIISLEFGHVLSNVLAENVFSVNLWVSNPVTRLLTLRTRESSVLVRHVNATITRTLERAEDTGTSGGSGQADIEESLERGL